jgi:putative transposase
MSRYSWVDTQKAQGFEVKAACEIAKVSRQAYYDWCESKALGPSEKEIDEALLINEIWDYHQSVDDSVGSPRMTTAMANRGYCTNHKRIERLMAENAIYAKDARRKKVKTTIPDEGEPQIPDRIKRDFSVGAPGIATCGDITYIPTDEGWLYLADVLDIGSRKIVGYAMRANMKTELVSSALEMAIKSRSGDVEGMIFHADRGSQYMSGDFKDLCDEHGILQSVGRTGSCFDNSVAESFWSTLKREQISRLRFKTRAEAKEAIAIWIHHYNNVRLHSSLGNVSPIEWELKYQQVQLKVA